MPNRESIPVGIDPRRVLQQPRQSKERLPHAGTARYGRILARAACRSGVSAMRPPRRLPALLPMLLTLSSAAAAPPATAPAAPAPADYALDVRELGSDEFAVRERATRRLWAAGAAAEPALKEAAAGDDPEASSRARRVLRNIRLGVRPDTAPDVLGALEEFDAADAEG